MTLYSSSVSYSSKWSALGKGVWEAPELVADLSEAQVTTWDLEPLPEGGQLSAVEPLTCGVCADPR